MDKLYTLQEAADYLKLHKRTITRYITDKKIKGNWIGGQWRIKSSELMRFVDDSESGGKDESTNGSRQ